MVCLHADYGYIVNWGLMAPGCFPKPSFHVFDRVNRSRIKRANWDEFLEVIRRLPDGIEIECVGKCTAPFDNGMPNAKRQALEKLFDEKRINATEDYPKFCYCTGDFVILFDEER